MLSFPDGFFADEVRDGFLVSEMMKRTWGSQLEIFDRIRALCSKYGITYFAEVGTLLGAVRHKGIIPWDDDIDLAMLRGDYMLFLEHAGEIGDDLEVRSIYSSDTFFHFHTVVAHKAETLEWDKKRMTDYHRCPFICAVDVFPLDYYPKDPDLFKVYSQLYCFSYKQLYDLLEYENEQRGGRLITYGELQRNSDAKELLAGIECLKGFVKTYMGTNFVLHEDKTLRNQLCRITDKVARMYNRSDSDGLDYSPKLPLGNMTSRPAWCYDSTTELPFEMTSIVVPAGYREVLSSIYGPNYMTPARGAAGHDYPFFKDEINVLVGGDIGERYVFSEVKRYLADSTDILYEAQGHVLRLLAEDNVSSALDVLAGLQNLAMETGDYVEKISDCSTDELVQMLTEYCELVYMVYKELEESYACDEERRLFFYGQLDDGLRKVKRAMAKSVHGSIPEKWLGAKKSIMMGVSATGIVNRTTDEISNTRELLSRVCDGNTQVFVAVSEGVEPFLSKCTLEIEGAYLELLQEMENNSEVSLIKDPTTAEIDALLALCDEYFGDRNKLSELCAMAGMEINLWE